MTVDRDVLLDRRARPGRAPHGSRRKRLGQCREPLLRMRITRIGRQQTIDTIGGQQADLEVSQRTFAVKPLHEHLPAFGSRKRLLDDHELGPHLIEHADRLFEISMRDGNYIACSSGVFTPGIKQGLGSN